MQSDAIAEAVRRLAGNRASPGPFDGLPQPCRPDTESDGYAVQAALRRQLSGTAMGRAVGAKIGCTTQVMQDYMKIGTPCAGTMFERDMHTSPANLRFADFHHVGVECEIAVRLASALPDSPGPDRIDDLAGSVEACMAAIEIVDDRYRDFRAIDTPTLIADDFFHAGCVLGPAVTDWRATDLGAVSGRMAINGEIVGAGQGSDILGHPFNALAWLADSGLGDAYALGAGSIVMLGSVVQTVWVAAGDVVSVEIEGLGTAEVRFV